MKTDIGTRIKEAKRALHWNSCYSYLALIFGVLYVVVGFGIGSPLLGVLGCIFVFIGYIIADHWECTEHAAVLSALSDYRRAESSTDLMVDIENFYSDGDSGVD